LGVKLSSSFCLLLLLLLLLGDITESQWLNLAGMGQNGVPQPVSGAPPPEIAVPPPKVIAPPPITAYCKMASS